MSKHKHPQSRSNRVSRWNMGNLPLSYPGSTPGTRVTWQTPTGKHAGVLANPPKHDSMYSVIEDGQSESVLVKYVRREFIEEKRQAEKPVFMNQERATDPE